jgi:hypothetical protein
MNDIERLCQRLELAQIVPSLKINEGAVPILLDERDEETFSSRWMESYRRLQTAKDTLGIGKETEALITRIREITYLQAYERWQSPDLAAYISDDFGLIADAIAANTNDYFVNALFHEYVIGNFPRGTLDEFEGNLAEQIE